MQRQPLCRLFSPKPTDLCGDFVKLAEQCCSRVQRMSDRLRLMACRGFGDFPHLSHLPARAFILSRSSFSRVTVTFRRILSPRAYDFSTETECQLRRKFIYMYQVICRFVSVERLAPDRTFGSLPHQACANGNLAHESEKRTLKHFLQKSLVAAQHVTEPVHCANFLDRERIII